MKVSTKRLEKKWIWRYQKKKEVPADKWASEGDFPTFFPVKKKKKGKQRNREQQQSKKIH